MQWRVWIPTGHPLKLRCRWRLLEIGEKDKVKFAKVACASTCVFEHNRYFVVWVISFFSKFTWLIAYICMHVSWYLMRNFRAYTNKCWKLVKICEFYVTKEYNTCKCTILISKVHCKSLERDVAFDEQN